MVIRLLAVRSLSVPREKIPVKKLIAVLTMLMLSLSVAAAERTGTVTIGGTDDTAGICAEKSLIDTRPVVISLDDNATTGFSWNGFIIGGDSVVLSGEEGTYFCFNLPAVNATQFECERSLMRHFLRIRPLCFSRVYRLQIRRRQSWCRHCRQAVCGNRPGGYG